MTTDTLRLGYRIACARDELEKAATRIETAQQWLVLIQSCKQSDMQTEVSVTISILALIAQLDLYLEQQM